MTTKPNEENRLEDISDSICQPVESFSQDNKQQAQHSCFPDISWEIDWFYVRRNVK
jgi:hypothetical protein